MWITKILMMKSLVTIVIPIYQEQPSDLEILSLNQTLTVLCRYPVTFMAPAGLNTAWYEDHCRGKATVHFEYFDWKGYEGYVNLMVSPSFYRRFQAYEYMLMCQLDAFVFRDELVEWCRMGYDCLGAVIYNDDRSWHPRNGFWRRLTGFTAPEYFANSGFTLKKVDTFHRMMSRFRHYIAFYRWVSRLRGVGFYDDLFISQHFPKLPGNFRLAPRALAEKFGADYMTYDVAELPFHNRDNDNLPFGIHGWTQRQLDFWRPCILRSTRGAWPASPALPQ